MEKPNGYLSLYDYIRKNGALPELYACKVYTDVSYFKNSIIKLVK